MLPHYLLRILFYWPLARPGIRLPLGLGVIWRMMRPLFFVLVAVIALTQLLGAAQVTHAPPPRPRTSEPKPSLPELAPVPGTRDVQPTRRRRKPCDLADPGGQTVENEEKHDPFDLFRGSAKLYTSQDSPFFVTAYGPTVLRWGVSDTGDLDGFGYLHIAGKHGWSPTDAAETRLALLREGTQAANGRGEDRYIFMGEPYESGRRGRLCVRTVVVDYGVASGDPEPVGIVTSYGQLVDSRSKRRRR